MAEDNGLIVYIDAPATRGGRWYRALDAVSGFTRASLSALGVGRSPPQSPGASYSVVATRPRAQDHLQQMSLSPAVYAAVQRRSRVLADAPIVVLRGEERVDPAKEAWAGEFLSLLQYPDPEELASRGDPTGLAPVYTGEHLIAQGVADYLLTGCAWIIPTAADSKRIVGLTRAHPRTMRIVQGGDYVEQVVPGRVTRYPRRGVFCLRSVSWQSSGEGELGVGAGEVLMPYVSAERTAMEKTAAVIDQGGADVIVTSNTPAGLAFLSNPANRDKVRKDVEAALAMREGSRVIVISGDLVAKPSGFTPAEIQAPELMTAARDAELMALGVTPVAIGLGTANFATAALQYRVQAELDESLAGVFESFLLRPLAQHYARAIGKGTIDARRITARIDLSTHPGYAYARTEAIKRMNDLVEVHGYTTEQAAAIEGQPFPKPLGTPRPKAATAPGAAAEIVQGDGAQRAAGAARETSTPEGD